MTRKKTPAKARKAKIPRGVKASVCVERGTGRIVFENVPPAQAPALLAETMAELRRLAEEHPELHTDLGSVGGYTPVEVVDDDWADEGKTRPRRKLGF